MALQIVAVNDAAPGACADVGMVYNGSTTITSSKIIAGTAMTMSGTAAITGNATFGGTVGITGTVALTDSATLGAGADLIGSSTSDITFNTDKFTVAGATGNTVIAGTLTQTGAAALAASATLGAGADLIGSSTSDITFNTNKFTVAGATGNTVIAGTLNVSGVLTSTNGFVGGTDADIVLNTDKVDINAGTGDVTIAGDFESKDVVATGNMRTEGHATTEGYHQFDAAIRPGADINAAVTGGAHTCDIDKLVQGFSPSSADIAVSLADTSHHGQMLYISYIGDTTAYEIVITPASLDSSDTTIVLAAKGETCLLMFASGEWHILLNTGATDTP